MAHTTLNSNQLDRRIEVDGNNLLLNKTSGLVSIGNNDPDTTFHVSGQSQVTLVNLYGYVRNNNDETDTHDPGPSGNDHPNMCARFDGKIAALNTVFAVSAFGSSDERIKTNFVELDDYQCLSQIRQIKPYTYNYIDTVTSGEESVIGFKAQEIKDVISGVVKTKKDFIPNIYKMCNKVSGSVISIPDISSYGLEIGSRLKFIEYIFDSDEVKNHEVSITDISGDNVTVSTTFTTTLTEVFVYGKEVEDFHYIGQNRITPVLTSALQEVDRRVISHFTGSHLCQKEDDSLDFSQYVGMIVSCGSSSDISIDKSSPKIKLSVGVNDKSVFGVVSRVEDDKVVVNSSGEGGIWVSSEGGNLEKGDYISSSSKSGYGMKQSDDLLHNYSIGKITCDCDFGNVGSLESKTVDGVTMCFVGCKYLC